MARKDVVSDEVEVAGKADNQEILNKAIVPPQNKQNSKTIVKYRVNVAMREYDVGDIIDIEFNEHGKPVKEFYRRRLAEAAREKNPCLTKV